jgi:hypothetical protein
MSVPCMNGGSFVLTPCFPPSSEEEDSSLGAEIISTPEVQAQVAPISPVGISQDASKYAEMRSPYVPIMGLQNVRSIEDPQGETIPPPVRTEMLMNPRRDVDENEPQMHVIPEVSSEAEAESLPPDEGLLGEIDVRDDPPTEALARALEMCSYESLSRLTVRSHQTRPAEALKSGVRQVLQEMDENPQQFDPKQVAEDQDFLDNVKDHILDADKFVAASFQNHLPAWEELLKESRRHTSKKVLKWIREGVKPVFDGTQNTEPKKMKRVRSLLRGAVPKGQVESFLKGNLLHEIEFQNHQSVYKHLPFVIGAVENLVVSKTAHLYGHGEGKPKVVNPLGVALNGVSERLVLNKMYINSS